VFGLTDVARVYSTSGTLVNVNSVQDFRNFLHIYNKKNKKSKNI